MGQTYNPDRQTQRRVGRDSSESGPLAGLGPWLDLSIWQWEKHTNRGGLIWYRRSKSHALSTEGLVEKKAWASKPQNTVEMGFRGVSPLGCPGALQQTVGYSSVGPDISAHGVRNVGFSIKVRATSLEGARLK